VLSRHRPQPLQFHNPTRIGHFSGSQDRFN
jgi:hypothetical protein